MAFLDRFAYTKTRSDELDHVVENLTAILNTKQGYGSVIGSLGIGGYLSRQASREAVSELTREIDEGIRRYEPRLKDMELKLLGRTADLQLCFEITGKVSGKRCKLRLMFDTTFGNVSLEKMTL
jgi:type VI secretion system protein